MRVIEPRDVIFSKQLQALKANSPMQVHPGKAISSVYVLESGITTFTSSWHSLKAKSETFVRAWGIITPKKPGEFTSFWMQLQFRCWCIQHSLPIQHQPYFIQCLSIIYQAVALKHCYPADFLLNRILTRKLFKESILQLLYCSNLCHINGKDIPLVR